MRRLTLGLFLLLHIGCGKPDSPETSNANQTQGQTSRPQEKHAAPADAAGMESNRGLEVIDVAKEDVRGIYISFATWYHGSDEKYHYILNRVGNDICRILRSELSDEELVNLFREKIARDRSKIPGMKPDGRSKEFLEWLRKTKVERIAGIDKNEDW